MWNESGWQWLNGVEHTDDAVDGCGHDYYHEIVVFLFDVLCASVSMPNVQTHKITRKANVQFSREKRVSTKWKKNTQGI